MARIEGLFNLAKDLSVAAVNELYSYWQPGNYSVIPRLWHEVRNSTVSISDFKKRRTIPAVLLSFITTSMHIRKLTSLG